MNKSVDEQIAWLLRYDKPYIWRGGALELLQSKDREVIIEGPSETGKTWAACYKSHILAREYAGANGALVRKVAASIPGTVLVTMKRIIGSFPVNYYGGDKDPERIIYPNGSTIWIGGMDKPEKVLSGERDFFQVCQAEELAANDWEIMTTRTTGRGAVMPFTQVFGDCNPGGRQHWIRERTAAGHLRLIHSRHQDNPALFDETGNLTAQGQSTLDTLDKLTGIRRKRLLEGIWATAEGIVYDTFSHDIHIKVRQPVEFQHWALALDEGYTNPAVILLIGIDGDGRLHIAREFYRTGVLQSSVCATAAMWAREFNTNVAIVDQSAAGLIADLRNWGLDAQGHKGRVLDGITIVQDLLRVQTDGRPRLTVDPDCVNSINEFESYVWKPGKDEPVKENDHAMDPTRYFAHWLYGDEVIQREVVYQPARIGI
jgi:phage terminase large subunit